MDKSWKDKAEEYLKTSHKYRLGVLPTEGFHPLTHNLSQLAKNDLPQAVDILQQVDFKIFSVLQQQVDQIKELQAEIQEVFKNGGRVFLCGCGATGRLSLTLDYLWKESFPNNKNQVVSFMSGGDVALVHSIEGFEDFPQYGSDHLVQLGFTEKDMLISCTEGGETPYVIGATNRAAQLSDYNTYFLYCNPDEVLLNIQRSKEVLENKKIKKINLNVGPMALSGSTRMQASSILLMAVGLALFETENDILININKFEEFYKKYDLNFMPSFIQEESNIYLGSGYLIYDVDEFAITVFTDLTERAPTFNLRAFERDISGDITGVSAKGNSLCYVHIKGAHNIEESWRLLLNREPHCLDWPEHSKMTTKTYMQGFDFSSTVFDNRLNRTGNENQIFKILMQDKNKVKLELGKQSHTMGLTGQGILYDHLLLKMILNIHSTLIMGILGRYENNVMSWVKPTNGKLIDRSARYVAKILQAKNIEPSYEEIVCAIFKNMDQVGNQQSIVLMVVDEFKPQ